MTVYQFSDPITRAADDVTPILFEWKRAGVTPSIEVAFDNVTFTAISGTVTEVTNDIPRYRINYNAADRLTTAGIITYKISEGNDVAYLELHITNPTLPPENLDVSSLSSLVESVGPRRVKTKDMEIENHSIEKIQKVMERNSTKPVGLGQIRGDIVRPKGNHWCN